MKGLRRVGTALSRLLLLAVAAVTAVSLLSARDGSLPRVLGLSHLVVVSGSMEPALKVGDMIIIRRQDSYQAGDIITFRDGGSFVTHRIAEAQGDDTFITRGDSNNTPDSRPVSIGQVEGSLLLRIPMAGRLLLYLKTTPGIISAALAAAILTLLSFRKETSTT